MGRYVAYEGHQVQETREQNQATHPTRPPRLSSALPIGTLLRVLKLTTRVTIVSTAGSPSHRRTAQCKPGIASGCVCMQSSRQRRTRPGESWISARGATAPTTLATQNIIVPIMTLKRPSLSASIPWRKHLKIEPEFRTARRTELSYSLWPCALAYETTYVRGINSLRRSAWPTGVYCIKYVVSSHLSTFFVYSIPVLSAEKAQRHPAQGPVRSGGKSHRSRGAGSGGLGLIAADRRSAYIWFRRVEALGSADARGVFS